ncbi:MAG: hypothetical protein AAF928_17545 [Myxococcota bacterium]
MRRCLLWLSFVALSTAVVACGDDDGETGTETGGSGGTTTSGATTSGPGPSGTGGSGAATGTGGGTSVTYEGSYSGSIVINCLSGETVPLNFAVAPGGALTGTWAASVVGGDLTASVDGTTGTVSGTTLADYGKGRTTECPVTGTIDATGVASGTFSCMMGVVCDGTWTANVAP